MTSAGLKTESYFRELRLFLEEICCNLCRFRHVEEDGAAPEDVRITQESYLGGDEFADIRVQVKQLAPYFLEVRYGYSASQIQTSLSRKYGPGRRLGGASKVVVLMDPHASASWAEVEPTCRLQDGLQLEVWDESSLFLKLRRYFGIEVDSISEENILRIRTAVDQASGKYAFEETWTGDSLQEALIWHQGFWRLKQLREGGHLAGRNIMPPGMYKDVAVVMADLCAFSSYVRDTRRDEVIRDCLTTFYAKARYEILNTGGMMYQFVGDAVLGLYGIPDQRDGYLESAFACSQALLDIGNSVSNKWQGQIDNVQCAKGLHIGIALGDMQIVSLRPFGRAHLGGIGEVINLASRLLAHAGPSEIVASNAYFQALGPSYRTQFSDCQPLDVRNMGRVRAWKSVAPAL